MKDPQGKLVEHIERLIDSASHDLHHEFQLHLRFILEKYKVWSRLKVNQKGSLEYMIKQEWRYLSDEEKATFTRYAREFVETLFPEFTKPQEELTTTQTT